jgi:hypothetical protein
MIEDFPSMGIKIMKAADNSKAVLGVLTNDLFDDFSRTSWSSSATAPSSLLTGWFEMSSV